MRYRVTSNVFRKLPVIDGCRKESFSMDRKLFKVPIPNTARRREEQNNGTLTIVRGSVTRRVTRSSSSSLSFLVCSKSIPKDFLVYRDPHFRVKKVFDVRNHRLRWWFAGHGRAHLMSSISVSMFGNNDLKEIWQRTFCKMTESKKRREMSSVIERRCSPARFHPSYNSNVDFTIALLLFVCALGLSIQVTRGTAVNRQRYQQYSRDWLRYYEASLSGTPPTGPAGKLEVPAVPDYYDYEAHTRGGPQSGSGFRYGADSGEPSTTSGPLITIKCYSCDYLNDWNHGQGLVGCLDSFVSKNIPTVECPGPCAKIYRKLEGKDDYFLSRNCMPNCKELLRLSDKGSYTECCSYNLCNQATGYRTTSRNCILIFILTAIAVAITNAQIYYMSYFL